MPSTKPHPLTSTQVLRKLLKGPVERLRVRSRASAPGTLPESAVYGVTHTSRGPVILIGPAPEEDSAADLFGDSDEPLTEIETEEFAVLESVQRSVVGAEQPGELYKRAYHNFLQRARGWEHGPFDDVEVIVTIRGKSTK